MIYFALVLVLLSSHAAFAQSPVGTRAEGMAGAFVGVADDATAVYWNPAGIAGGPIVSAVISLDVPANVGDSAQVAESQRDKGGVVAFSATAIGVAYYRVTSYGLRAAEPAVTGPPSREEVGHSVHAISTQTIGVSLLQSLTEHLVVAATPKFVRGMGASAVDVDAGVMFSQQHVRVGLVGHNLTTPAFSLATAEDDSGAIALRREVRAGAAWGSGWPGISRVIVSVDADVTSRVTPGGDRRDVAAGVETWWRNQRVGVRGGVRRSAIGDPRAAFAAGVSAAVKPGMLIEAQVTRGHAHERSWGVGARMLF